MVALRRVTKRIRVLGSRPEPLRSALMIRLDIFFPQVEIQSLSGRLAPPLRGATGPGGAHRIASLRGHGEAAATRASSSLFSSDPSAQWVLAGSISGLCLLSGHIAGFFGGIVGLAYPTYLSIKALEAGSAPAEGGAGCAHEKAKRELLTYWVCFSLLSLAESLVGPWVKQIQHYEAIKVGVLFWLHRHGARSIYSKWLRPVIRENEARVETVVNEVAGQAEERFIALKARTSHNLRAMARATISSMNPAH